MIYVDGLINWPGPPAAGAERYFGNGKPSCHLWCDRGEEEELHELAESIGLRRAWYQKARRLVETATPLECSHCGLSHYDLTPGKRALALKAGATETDLAKWLLANEPWEWID